MPIRFRHWLSWEFFTKKLQYFFTENILSKVIALVVALILYMLTTGEKNVVTSMKLRLEIVTPESLVVTNTDKLAKEIIFDIKGPRVRIQSVVNRHEFLTLDLTGSRPGVNSVRIHPEMLKLPPGVEVTRISPSEIEPRLAPLVNKKVDVKLVLEGDVASGYRLVQQEVRPPKIEIQGSANKLASVASIPTEPLEKKEEKKKSPPPAEGEKQLSFDEVPFLDPFSVAEELAKKQRSISISEFFTKNRHLLGFDNPRKALLTAVKEAVDNSLDACEEARILPEIQVKIDAIKDKKDRFKLSVTDNGPGIVKSQIPQIFGSLLYGSKFHTLKMSRGQQGIGISAAAMYGQITTGKSVFITSRTSPRRKAHHFELRIDMQKNKPVIIKDEEVEWKQNHGTMVEFELEGKFQRGRQSVDDYLRTTMVANPHVSLTYKAPDGEKLAYQRSVNKLPPEPKEIKPHPYGVELGIFLRMLHGTKARNVKSFLQNDFSRIPSRIALQILSLAKIDPSTKPAKIAAGNAEAIYKAIQDVKIMNPATDCIAPMGEDAVLKGLQRELEADFYTATSRPPSVYRGNPFVIEVGIAYGGEQPSEESATLLRFANRVPLLYQQGACAITRSVVRTDWKNYNLTQPRDSLPIGPLTIFVHMASVWVPFTSESKEAIADYPEIKKEIRLALQECGRKLQIFVRRRRRAAEAARKKGYIETYIPHIGEALQEILGLPKKEEKLIVTNLRSMLEKGKVT
ncbi:DNA topoisomerase VI subunit B [Bdellovibrionota bacterium]